MKRINTDRLVNTFCELVKIPSESSNEAQFIDYMDKFFKIEGAKTKKDAYGNLIARFASKNSNNKNILGFICHADTVKPGVGIRPIVESDKIRSHGDTILGADDKAGLAEVIEMLRTAQKHPPIEVILTKEEEIGSLGSVNLDYSLVASKMAVVLDMENIDELVVGGPTLIIMDVFFKGKPSHAGMAPEKGISSIYAASKAISQLRLGKLDEESTANVGVIQGGEIRNGVPEHTKVMAECRSLDHEKALKIADEMEATFKKAGKEVGAEVKIDRRIPLKAYKLDVNTDIVKFAQEALISNGIKVKTTIIRGGTDATHFNSHGIPTAVLGVGYREEHSCTEYVIISDMEAMTHAMVDLVEKLA